MEYVSRSPKNSTRLDENTSLVLLTATFGWSSATSLKLRGRRFGKSTGHVWRFPPGFYERPRGRSKSTPGLIFRKPHEPRLYADAINQHEVGTALRRENARRRCLRVP